MTNTLRRVGAAAVPAVLLLALSACGGGGRPSVSDIENWMKDASNGQVSGSQAECAAKVIHDSDISDGALKKIVDTKKESDFADLDKSISKDDEKAAEDIDAKIEKCMSK